MIEYGVDEFLAPLALDGLVMDEVRFLAHPESLHEAGGCCVLGRAAANDPVQAQVVEPPPEHYLGRLSGPALALVVGLEDEADLALPAVPAQPFNTDPAGYRSRLP